MNLEGVTKLNRAVPIFTLAGAVVLSATTVFADGSSFRPQTITSLAVISSNSKPSTTLAAAYIALTAANLAVSLAANSTRAYANLAAGAAVVAGYFAEASAAASSSSSSGIVSADPTASFDSPNSFD